MSNQAAKADLSRIRIALCGKDRRVLLQVRHKLMSIGYLSTTLIRSDAELRFWATAGFPDLIIADHSLDDGAAIQTIKDIRSGDLGENPFVVTIITTWTNDTHSVRTAINCGIDDLIVAPFSADQVLERMRKMIAYRKPFIVTCDYIGPERRQDPSRINNIPTFELPNSLRMRQEGEAVDFLTLRDQIAKSKTEITEEKLRRIGFQIAFLVDLILPEFGLGEFKDEFIQNLNRLVSMSSEAVKRLQNTKYAPLFQLCKSFHKLLSRIAAHPQNATPDDVELLKPLAFQMYGAFFPNEQASDLADQISSAVSNYKIRRARMAS